MTQEDKVAEAERQAAAQAEDIYESEQKQAAAGKIALAAKKMPNHALVGGVKPAETGAQEEVSAQTLEEEKQQMAQELKQATELQAQQQRENIAAQNAETVKKHAEESKQLDL